MRTEGGDPDINGIAKAATSSRERHDTNRGLRFQR